MRVDVLDNVEHVIGSGSFHNFHFFKSVDSLGAIFEVQIRHSLFHWPRLYSSTSTPLILSKIVAEIFSDILANNQGIKLNSVYITFTCFP